jgi:hypothetical protein
MVFAPASAVGPRRGRSGVCNRRVAARYVLKPPLCTSSRLEVFTLAAARSQLGPTALTTAHYTRRHIVLTDLTDFVQDHQLHGQLVGDVCERRAFGLPRDGGLPMGHRAGRH